MNPIESFIVLFNTLIHFLMVLLQLREFTSRLRRKNALARYALNNIIVLTVSLKHWCRRVAFYPHQNWTLPDSNWELTYQAPVKKAYFMNQDFLLRCKIIFLGDVQLSISRSKKLYEVQWIPGLFLPGLILKIWLLFQAALFQPGYSALAESLLAGGDSALLLLY